MSLLMDALRRAEADNAKDTVDTSADAGEVTDEAFVPAVDDAELQLEPVDSTSAAVHAEAPVPEVANDAAAESEPLSLEDAGDSGVDTAAIVDDSPAAQASPDAGRVLEATRRRPARLGRHLVYVLSAIGAVAVLLAGYYIFGIRPLQQADSATLLSTPTKTADVPWQAPEPAAGIVQTVESFTGEADHTPAVEAVESAPTAAPVNVSSEPVGRTEAETDSDSRVARIEIRRNRAGSRQVPPQLSRAYAAYSQQDYDAAKPLYREVLRAYPDNRDALLGLAAIAVHQSDQRLARYYYTQLLKTNPADQTALLAMQSLAGNDGQLEYGSQLKHWLNADSGNAGLQFALGNQHAANGRWKEAQQAYFEAHRLKPDNADYAFNLAVSLDRLGLASQALDYYLAASRLATTGNAGFSNRQVDRRIAQLRAQTGRPQ